MLKVTHFFFGPVVFSVTVYAALHPGESLYMCGDENTDPSDISFSVSNLFALVLCFAITGTLTYFKIVSQDWLMDVLQDENSLVGIAF